MLVSTVSLIDAPVIRPGDELPLAESVWYREVIKEAPPEWAHANPAWTIEDTVRYGDHVSTAIHPDRQLRLPYKD